MLKTCVSLRRIYQGNCHLQWIYFNMAFFLYLISILWKDYHIPKIFISLKQCVKLVSQYAYAKCIFVFLTILWMGEFLNDCRNIFQSIICEFTSLFLHYDFFNRYRIERQAKIINKHLCHNQRVKGKITSQPTLYLPSISFSPFLCWNHQFPKKCMQLFLHSFPIANVEQIASLCLPGYL